jgi:CheY-like chemotaxis protein
MPEKRILLVEHDATNARFLTNSLQGLGLLVEVAVDYLGTLAKLRQRTPDLLMICAELPGQSGYALCNQIKRTPSHQKLPIIIISSDPSERPFLDHQRLNTKTRADVYLHKPISIVELIEQLETLIELPEQSIEKTLLPREDNSEDEVTGMGERFDLSSMVEGAHDEVGGTAPEIPLLQADAKKPTMFPKPTSLNPPKIAPPRASAFARVEPAKKETPKPTTNVKPVESPTKEAPRLVTRAMNPALATKKTDGSNSLQPTPRSTLILSAQEDPPKELTLKPRPIPFGMMRKETLPSMAKPLKSLEVTRGPQDLSAKATRPTSPPTETNALESTAPAHEMIDASTFIMGSIPEDSETPEGLSQESSTMPITLAPPAITAPSTPKKEEPVEVSRSAGFSNQSALSRATKRATIPPLGDSMELLSFLSSPNNANTKTLGDSLALLESSQESGPLTKEHPNIELEAGSAVVVMGSKETVDVNASQLFAQNAEPFETPTKEKDLPTLAPSEHEAPEIEVEAKESLSLVSSTPPTPLVAEDPLLVDAKLDEVYPPEPKQIAEMLRQEPIKEEPIALSKKPELEPPSLVKEPASLPSEPPKPAPSSASKEETKHTLTKEITPKPPIEVEGILIDEAPKLERPQALFTPVEPVTEKASMVSVASEALDTLTPTAKRERPEPPETPTLEKIPKPESAVVDQIPEPEIEKLSFVTLPKAMPEQDTPTPPPTKTPTGDLTQEYARLHRASTLKDAQLKAALDAKDKTFQKLQEVQRLLEEEQATLAKTKAEQETKTLQQQREQAQQREANEQTVELLHREYQGKLEAQRSKHLEETLQLQRSHAQQIEARQEQQSHELSSLRQTHATTEESLQAQLSALQKEKLFDNNQHESIRAELSQRLNTYESQSKQLAQKNQELEAKTAQLTREQQELEQSTNDIQEELKAQLESQQQQLEELTLEKELILRELGESKANVKHLDQERRTLSAELSRTQSSLETLQDEHARSNEELKLSEARAEVLERDVKLSREEFSRKEREYNDTNEELAEQGEALQKTQEELTRKERELRDTKEELSKRDKELRSIQEELSRKERELRNTQNDAARKEQDLQADLLKRQAELRALQDGLSQREQDARALQDELARRDGELRALESQLSRQEKELASAKERLLRTEQELRTSQVDLNRTEQALQLEIRKRETDIHALQDELDQREQLLRALQDDLLQREQSQGELELELSSLNQKLQRLTNDSNLQKEEINELSEIVREREGALQSKQRELAQQSIEQQKLLHREEEQRQKLVELEAQGHKLREEINATELRQREIEEAFSKSEEELQRSYQKQQRDGEVLSRTRRALALALAIVEAGSQDS